MIKKLALFLALVFIFLFKANAYADDGYMGGVGETPRPRNSIDIEMQAEVVNVILHKTFAEVECAYRFKNHGKAQKVIMGFPELYMNDVNEYTYETKITQFRAFLDGAELPVTKKKIDYNPDRSGPWYYNEYGVWYLQEVAFKQNQTRVVVNRYLAPHGGTSVGDRNFSYVLETGSTWKGAIGQANVNIIFANGMTWDHFKPNMSGIRPEGYKKYQDGFSWSFKNFEPKFQRDSNIHIYYFPEKRNPTTNPVPKQLDATASSYLAVGQYRYPANQAFDGSIETAWAEGMKGAGIGQNIKATFMKPQQIQEIRILPGYVKTAELFKKYGRPKLATLTFSNGMTKRVKFTDDPHVHYFALEKPIKASWARLTIDDIYRGSAANYTYITEIEFAPGKTRARANAADLLSKIKISSQALGGQSGSKTVSGQVAVKGTTVTTGAVNAAATTTDIVKGQVTDGDDNSTQTTPVEAADVIVIAIIIIALILLISFIPRDENKEDDKLI